MATIEGTAHKLACLEIWGGNHRVARGVELPGLAGWVYSHPSQNESAGGDLHYLSVCGQGRLTRVGLADVSGHGQMVSRVAECLRDAMRMHIGTLDQGDLLRDLNHHFQQQCTPGMKFASLFLLGIYGRNGTMVFSNAGQPAPLWYRAAQEHWQCLEESTVHAPDELADLPLGVVAGTDYHQDAARLMPGDLLLLYSDGLLEARNPQGEILGPERLLELAGRIPVDSPQAAGEALLAAANDFRGGALPHDDETLLALRALPNRS